MPSLELENQVVYLRKTYHFGQLKISWYLKRYHDVSISSNGVRNILLRHGLNRLPRNQRKATTAQPKLYEKQQPGYHVQVDVKFLFFKDKENRRIKRYQYTAIDDATRLRILKVYARHTQKSSIDFVNHIVAKFPFRIRQIRTDNGHEFKSQFNWHLRDLGIDHVAIKPASPHLNGKVERSHRIDQEEFYPLVSYVNDDDLQKKIEAWEKYYNRDRPHSAHRGMTPLEALNQKLKLG
jgi:transposase InsO family protein